MRAGVLSIVALINTFIKRRVFTVLAFDFDSPNIEVAEISEDKRYGKFIVEPLERGYGITLGNSLRRIKIGRAHV